MTDREKAEPISKPHPQDATIAEALQVLKATGLPWPELKEELGL